MRGFDLYRQLPRELTEATSHGAFFSVVTIVFVLYLFCSELGAYLGIRRESSMFIDEFKGSDKLQVNLDITFSKAPCDVICLDATDIMGNHEVDIHGNLFKHRLSRDGTEIEKLAIKGSHLHTMSSLSRHSSNRYGHKEVDRVKEHVKNEEGCRISGFLRINKVPGTLHISTHSFFPLMDSLWDNTDDMLDISHKISHLSFGSDEDISYVRQKFPESGIIAPLDTVERFVPRSEMGTATAVSYEYYLKIVPTSYETLGHNTTNVFQFTASSNQVPRSYAPSIYFRYDFSPVSVLFHDEMQQSFLQFLIHICAIIGGVFSAAGMLNAVVNRTVHLMVQKDQVGKLG